MIEIVIVNILRTTIISSIGICLILLLKKTLFKEYTKNFNYYIWLIVIFRMILPFEIPIYIGTNSIISNNIEINNSFDNIKLVSNSVSNMQSINYPLNNTQAIETTKQFTNNFNMLEILGYLWLVITIIIVTYRIFTYIKFKNTIIDLSLGIGDRKIRKIYNSLRIEMKINKNIQLKVSDYTCVPLGIGFFKSYIVLPNIHYEEKEAEWILKHELMHYKKKDILYKFLVMATTSIYWFNPFIYVMNRYINIECELACDERILYSCDFKERQNYALTLINSLKHKESNFLENNLSTKLGNKTVLERRFESMFNKKTKKGTLIGILAIILATSSFGIISNKNGLDILGSKEVEASTVEANEDSIQSYEIENRDNNQNEKIIVKPTIPQWSLEQTTGANMVDIDYASDNMVIFHGYFGLFVYDLNKLDIVRSLDLKPIHCDYTQGDSYCEVEVSKDGKTVQLHANDSEKMYIYYVSDNTLCETNYRPMENSFQSQLVEIGKAINKRNGALSYYAVQFDSGEYGYLTSGEGTLKTLDYVRGDKIYSLFKSAKKSYAKSNDSEKVGEISPTVDNNLIDNETIISEDSKGGVVKLLPMPGADSDKVQEIPLPVPDTKSKVAVSFLD
ncbi:hypothetical protein psyc5s11_32480 [Clostridium gelidum]|uniref:Peptidase M56 domain-containing protein n=1 Tax=Clostridium gelidum TaxID=704125 RepID=A0ABM7TE87_9CLOT|nr:M56 family metallopeptidase [Clostridium gelidum]BCZ47181.1 hypothetical protein psyc5s11_32480 [Clostridium gelidum]